MRAPRPALLLATLLGLGCQPDARDVRLTLELPRAIGCRPTSVDEVEVRALGDFPPGEPNVVVFDPEAGAQRIERFPDRTLLLAVEARGSIGPEPWLGGGVAVVGDRSSAEVVTLLRYGRSCPVGDATARVPEGAAATALADGRVWIAGGHEDGRVLEGIVTLRPGDALATRSGARLFVDRTGATATALPGELVVLIGGAGAIDGAGEDTLEIIDARADARVGDGFLRARRHEHAAIAVGERAVLLAGGRDRPGDAPHAELELVTIDEGGARGESELAGRLAVPRAGATALALDDGRVAIAGGVDARGAAVGAIELYDPASRAVTRAAELPPRANAAYAALPGARVVQIGGALEGEWSREVEVALGETVIALGAVLPELAAPRATTLADGRVLVIGRDESTMRARGVLLDVGTGRTEAVDASRAATVLLPLPDGSVAEGDAAGLSALRVDLRTPFDSPPATLFPALPEDRARLALDAPGRWRAEGGALVAGADDARFDLAGLRFASFALSLDASGVVELLLVGGERAPATITLAQDAVELGACRVPRADGAPLSITRAGERVIVDAGAGAADCALDHAGRVGLAVRARSGASVRSLSIARR